MSVSHGKVYFKKWLKAESDILFWWYQETCGPLGQMHWESGWLYRNIKCFTTVWLLHQNFEDNCLYFSDYTHTRAYIVIWECCWNFIT
jgi:hypothetical protein